MSDERLKKTNDDARQTRLATDRTVTEDREISDDERIEMFRMNLFQEKLPNLPKIPGFHVCWLTTNNSSDTIPQRIRLGYQLIRSEEIPGYDYHSVKTGDYSGVIGVNEMLAAKLPLRLYHAYMNEAHFDAPNREGERIEAMVDSIKESVEVAGGRVIEGDGMAELTKRVSRPAFGD